MDLERCGALQQYISASACMTCHLQITATQSIFVASKSAGFFSLCEVKKRKCQTSLTSYCSRRSYLRMELFFCSLHEAPELNMLVQLASFTAKRRTEIYHF